MLFGGGFSFANFLTDVPRDIPVHCLVLVANFSG